MFEILRDIVARNRTGERIATLSVCSDQIDVLRTFLKYASAKVTL